MNSLILLSVDCKCDMCYETKEEVSVEPRGGKKSVNSKYSKVSDSSKTEILTASHSLADIRPG